MHVWIQEAPEIRIQYGSGSTTLVGRFPTPKNAVDATANQGAVYYYTILFWQLEDQDKSKQNAVFHADDVRIFRRSIHHWNRDLTEILPGIYLSSTHFQLCRYGTGTYFFL